MSWSKKIVGTSEAIIAHIQEDKYLPSQIKEACIKSLEGIINSVKDIIIFETNGHIGKYNIEGSVESYRGSSVEIKFYVCSRA